MKAWINLSLRIRRAWCALFHEWTLHRGFWRCVACQPEVHNKRKPAAPDLDPRQQPLPIEPERGTRPSVAWEQPGLHGTKTYTDSPTGYMGERLVRVGGPGEPSEGPQS